MKRETKAERQREKEECLTYLRGVFAVGKKKPLTEFGIVLMRRTNYGTRFFKVLVGSDNGCVSNITYSVAKACGFRLKQTHDNLIMTTNDGAAIASELSRALGVRLVGRDV